MQKLESAQSEFQGPAAIFLRNNKFTSDISRIVQSERTGS